MTPMQYRLMIVDDHALIRMGLATVFNDTSDMRVIADGDSFSDIVRVMDNDGCDLLLLDIDLPGRNGIDILKLVKKDYPRLPVLRCAGFGAETPPDSSPPSAGLSRSTSTPRARCRPAPASCAPKPAPTWPASPFTTTPPTTRGAAITVRSS